MLDYQAPIFRHFWYPVAAVRDICDAPVAVELLGTRLVVARLDGEIVCFHDRCIHRGMPLSAGKIVGQGRAQALQCAYHGYCFGAAGDCTGIPGLDRARIPAGAHLQKPHGVAERYGLVWVALDRPARPIPALPDYDDPRFHCGIAGPMRWATDAATIADNFLDLNHFGFVHAATFGSLGNPPAEVTIVQRGLDFTFETEHVGRKATAGGLAAGEPDKVYRRKLTYAYTAPFCVDLKLEFLDAPLWDRLFIVIQPESAVTSRVFKLVLNEFPLDSEERRREGAAQKQVNAEDQKAAELVGPRDFSLDLDAQFHSPLDAPAVALRRSLARLIAGGVEAAARATDSAAG